MTRKAGDLPDTQVLLVGQLFPDSLASKILQQEIPPVQTQRFGNALVEALKVGFRENVEVLSTAPLVDFPHSRLLFAPRAKWRIDGKIQATMMPFLNVAVLKHLTRFIGTIAFVSQWILKNKDSRRIMVLHGVQSCKLWGVLLAQIFAPCMIVVYLTDDLGISLKWEKSLLKKFRFADVTLMKRGLQKVSGVIAMTPELAEKLAPGCPLLVMPTIRQSVPDPLTAQRRKANDGVFNIVYTGNLGHSYGLGLLLDTFSQANRPNWHLLISGWGEMEDLVRDFARNHRRVEYLGLLGSEELLKLRERADVFVNPKLTSTPTSSLAFPSKIVEYLSTGKPVVSTDLPIFDMEFKRQLIIARSDSPEEFIRCLDQIMAWDDDQCEAWRLQTLRFVNQELSPDVQGARIRGFTDSLKYQN